MPAGVDENVGRKSVLIGMLPMVFKNGGGRKLRRRAGWRHVWFHSISAYEPRGSAA